MKKTVQALMFALVLPLAAVPFAISGTTRTEPSDASSMCGRCGDGYCAKQCGETATSCPRDCGTAS